MNEKETALPSFGGVDFSFRLWVLVSRLSCYFSMLLDVTQVRTGERFSSPKVVRTKKKRREEMIVLVSPGTMLIFRIVSFWTGERRT